MVSFVQSKHVLFCPCFVWFTLLVLFLVYFLLVLFSLCLVYFILVLILVWFVRSKHVFTKDQKYQNTIKSITFSGDIVGIV